MIEAVNSRGYRWYEKDVFPLVPQLKTRKGDAWNTRGFTFKWLFLTAWTLDAPQFELTLVCSSHWGIGFIGVLPYLRWSLTIPMPSTISSWCYKHLWRRP